jgi:hypothetical protein
MTVKDDAFWTALQATVTPTPRICKEGGEGIFLPFDADSELDMDQTGRGILYIAILGW